MIHDTMRHDMVLDYMVLDYAALGAPEGRRDIRPVRSDFNPG
jgi:hypothetical protein